MDDHSLQYLTDKLSVLNDEDALKDKLLFDSLSRAINELAKSDFEKLISLLYRMDIDEQKLRYHLKLNKDSNAGDIIASLMIERQLKKIESRKKYRKPDEDIPEDERW
jgi:hypothetical protein